MTYADNPKAHIRTEFGFDVTQVAKNRYTSDRYHDFIGFEISKPVLERAFQDTYGVQLNEVIPNEDLAIGTFRRAIGAVIPEMTRVALVAYKKEIVSRNSEFQLAENFVTICRGPIIRKSGVKDIGVQDSAPAFWHFFEGSCLRWDHSRPLTSKSRRTKPKICISPALITHSITTKVLLAEVNGKKLTLPNTDFDTGKITHAGEYVLTDNAYAHLLDQLAKIISIRSHQNFEKIFLRFTVI